MQLINKNDLIIQIDDQPIAENGNMKPEHKEELEMLLERLRIARTQGASEEDEYIEDVKFDIWNLWIRSAVERSIEEG